MNLDSSFALHKNQYPEIGSPDMRKKIGDELRTAREFNDMSIDQVRSITKINTSYLECIENGNWSFLPPVYVKLFVRAFADAVKMQSDDFYQRLNELFVSIKQLDHLPEVSDFFNENLGDYGTKGFGSSPIWAEKNKSLLIAGGLSVIAIIIVLWLLLKPTAEEPTANTAEVIPAQTEMLTPIQRNIDTTSTAAANDDVVSEDNEAVIAEANDEDQVSENTFEQMEGMFEINIIAKENCYVKVEHADSVLYDRTLWPGNELTKQFPEPIKLTLGNAPGVSLIVRGDTLPEFSANRKVRVLRIDSNGLIR